MNRLSLFVLMHFALSAFAQKNNGEQAIPIIEEGKLLYQSEMASWYGTDIFLAEHQNRDDIGGYFSYVDSGRAKCIFFTKEDAPTVVGEIAFNGSYNVKDAKTDLSGRIFTATEKELYAIRKTSLDEINSDTALFKHYRNTDLNLIPLINDGEKKVFVLTGPQKDGVIIFGNDYLLTFNKNNKLVSKKRIHQNIIVTDYKNTPPELKTVEGGVHNHLPETGDFITSTDICTLMLYEKFAHWKTYEVVSEKYVSLWDCENDLLVVAPKDKKRK